MYNKFLKIEPKGVRKHCPADQHLHNVQPIPVKQGEGSSDVFRMSHINALVTKQAIVCICYLQTVNK